MLHFLRYLQEKYTVSILHDELEFQIKITSGVPAYGYFVLYSTMAVKYSLVVPLDEKGFRSAKGHSTKSF